MQAGQSGFPFTFICQDQYDNIIDFTGATSIILLAQAPGGVLNGAWPLTLGTTVLTLPDGTEIPAGQWTSYVTTGPDFPLAGDYLCTITGTFPPLTVGGIPPQKISCEFTICVGANPVEPGDIMLAGSLNSGPFVLGQAVDVDQTTQGAGKVLSCTPSNGKPYSWVTPT